MSYRTTAAIAADPTFRARVSACLLEVAQAVAEEPTTTPAGTPDTREGTQVIDASWRATTRPRLAYQVLAEPTCCVTPFTWLCAAHPQVQAAASHSALNGALVINESAGKADDAVIRTVVTASWDRVARWRAAHTN